MLGVGSLNAFRENFQKYGELISDGYKAFDAKVADVGNPAIVQLNKTQEFAQQIANAFTKELNDMRAIGIKVGDVTQGGRNGYYFPQVWDVEAIRENPNAFINGLLEMFVREQNSPDFEGTRLTRDEIQRKQRTFKKEWLITRVWLMRV